MVREQEDEESSGQLHDFTGFIKIFNPRIAQFLICIILGYVWFKKIRRVTKRTMEVNVLWCDDDILFHIFNDAVCHASYSFCEPSHLIHVETHKYTPWADIDTLCLAIKFAKILWRRLDNHYRFCRLSPRILQRPFGSWWLRQSSPPSSSNTKVWWWAPSSSCPPLVLTPNSRTWQTWLALQVLKKQGSKHLQEL